MALHLLVEELFAWKNISLCVPFAPVLSFTVSLSESET